MSNRMKIKVKRPRPIKPKRCVEALHKSFNIFSRYGENRVVTSPRPMTLSEAQDYYHALAISAND